MCYQREISYVENPPKEEGVVRGVVSKVTEATRKNVTILFVPAGEPLYIT